MLRLLFWLVWLGVLGGFLGCDDRVAADRDALDVPADSTGVDGAASDIVGDSVGGVDASLGDHDAGPEPDVGPDGDETVDVADAPDAAPARCAQVDPTAFGDCNVALGVGFDGATCVPISGCDCGSDCDELYASRADCAFDCGEAGRCNDAVLVGVALAQGQPVRAGSLCDGIDLCADEAMRARLEAVFDAVYCDASGTRPCRQGLPCHVAGNLVLSADQASLLCALSFAVDDRIECPVYGP